MVNKQQAETANHFHFGECHRSIGPRGAVKDTIKIVRRTGRTKVWKTRPDNFQTPVKYGLYESGYITQDNASAFHIPEECPIRGFGP